MSQFNAFKHRCLRRLSQGSVFLLKTVKQWPVLSLSLAAGLAAVALFAYIMADSAPIDEAAMDPAKLDYYQVAVYLAGQDETDPLKPWYGDAFMIQGQNFLFSSQDLASYMIIKMDLSEKEVQKLNMPVQRELAESELPEEVQAQRREMREQGEKPEPYLETIANRKYRTDMDRFGNIGVDDLKNGQPYLDKVYGWKIVEERE